MTDDLKERLRHPGRSTISKCFDVDGKDLSNAPLTYELIWLQAGDAEVTWCQHSQDDEDVPYVREDFYSASLARITELEARLAAAEAGEDALANGRHLYLDLDGVMADFDAHFPAAFGTDHRAMADDAMWATINAHPSFFRDLPMCEGAAEFWREIQHLRPIILTACPRTNYQHVAVQKREWCRKHLSSDVTVLPVLGGRNKWLFMHQPGDVLIDDVAKNIGPWDAAGGVGILHRSFAETRAALAAHDARRKGK